MAAPDEQALGSSEHGLVGILPSGYGHRIASLGHAAQHLRESGLLPE
jgi:hypothetical protein